MKAKIKSELNYYLGNLNEDEQIRMCRMYESKRKTVLRAYLMWFFLGGQYAYLGQYGTLILYWCTFGACGFWTFIDAFRIPGMVRKYNLSKASEIYSLIKR